MTSQPDDHVKTITSYPRSIVEDGGDYTWNSRNALHHDAAMTTTFAVLYLQNCLVVVRILLSPFSLPFLLPSPFPPSHFPLLFLLVSLFFLPSLPLLLLSPPHYLSLLSLLTTLLRSGRSGCSWSVLVPPTVPPLPTSWSAPRRCSRLSRNLGCWKGQCPNHQPHSHILISHSQSP